MIQLYGCATEALPSTETLLTLLPSAWIDVWRLRHGRSALHNGNTARQSLGGLWLLYQNGIMGQLYYNDVGRPGFCNRPQTDFNLSHSSAFVCCAYSEAADPRVGVDAEELSRISSLNYHALAKRWFSEAELAELNAHPSPMQFVRLWTRKEALVKLTGQGLTSMRSTDTIAAEHQGNVRFAEYRVADTWISLCCMPENLPPPTLQPTLL